MEEYIKIKDEDLNLYPSKPTIIPSSGYDHTVKAIVSILVYLMVGFVFFRNVTAILILLSIILIHELGHLLAMKFFHYKESRLLFIPILGAFVTGKKREVSQIQSAVIYLSGPIPGIFIGFLFILLHKILPGTDVFGFSLQIIGELFIWLNAFNLLPIFPLDGGQLLNRLYLNEDAILRKVFIVFSIIAISAIAYIYKIYVLFIIPVFLISKAFKASKTKELDKEIEASGINIDQSYENLSDKEYWLIRKILIAHLPQYSNIKSSLPISYDVTENKIAQDVENVLQKNLIQDAGLVEKIIIALIWVTALASPWFISSSIILKFLQKTFN